FDFFLNATSPPAISSLSLHDALPIWKASLLVFQCRSDLRVPPGYRHEAIYRIELHAEDSCLWPQNCLPLSRQRDASEGLQQLGEDRKSTRLNSSHVEISYAVFCLKKK